MECAARDMVFSFATASEACGPTGAVRAAPPAWPRLAAVAVCFLLMVHNPQRADAAAAPEEVRDTVEGVFAAGDYQRDLPLPVATDGTGGGAGELWSDPDWWRNEGGSQAPDFYRPRAAESDDFELNLPPAVARVLKVLMWVVFFAGGALVAYYLMNEARLFSRWKKGDWQKEGESGDAAAGGTPGRDGAQLEDYEILAGRGEFAEAVHALLLRSIALIRDRGIALSSALTSREILRQAPLQDRERDALSTLVGVTEVTHFGGRGATEADFLRCRDLFERIAQGSAGRAG